jgi:molybdopterin converting factor subunit 1
MHARNTTAWRFLTAIYSCSVSETVAATSIRVHVRLFASYREAAGTNRLDTSLPTGSTVADLVAALASQIPPLTRTRGMIALNQEYVTPEATLHDGDEVALIPPVSGG